VLPGLEDVPFVQTWRQVLKKRRILALIWVAGAAIAAGIVVFIFTGKNVRRRHHFLFQVSYG